MFLSWQTWSLRYRHN